MFDIGKFLIFDFFKPGGNIMPCLFCSNFLTIELENELSFAIYDQYPVNKGHMLIIPKRHFSSFFEATPDEIEKMYELINDCKEKLDKQYQPDGYNVGVNIGEAAGQTIMHLHIHLIPRYNGDVEKPAGGVRHLKSELVPYDG